MVALVVDVHLRHHPQVWIMLWTIVAIFLILWLLGFSFHIAGSLIHVLLIVALIVFVAGLFNRRRV